MAWNWYQIKKVDETMQEGVPDETLSVTLNLGEETIRFIQGFSVGIIFRNFLLFPNMNGRNPFTKNDEVGAIIFEDYYWVGVNLGDE
jgi:hypothetical protein